jgi:hypothetical protein
MMDIEKIEQFVNQWYKELSSTPDAKQSEIVPMMELSLLLAIYKKMESIDDSLSSMSTDSWNDHHNH